MTAAATSIFYYSFYMMGMGLGLLFIQGLLLGLFGFPPTSEFWVRVLGLFAFCAGTLYFYCGRTEQAGFFRISVPERVVFFLGTLGIVMFAQAAPMLAVIGGIDLLGAIWTGLALRKVG